MTLAQRMAALWYLEQAPTRIAIDVRRFAFVPIVEAPSRLQEVKVGTPTSMSICETDPAASDGQAVASLNVEVPSSAGRVYDQRIIFMQRSTFRRAAQA